MTHLKNTKTDPGTQAPRHVNDAHMADLRRSGLTDETIADAGIYSADAVVIAELLGGWDIGCGGMVIPYPHAPDYVRIRPDTPVTMPDGTMAKYLSRPGAHNLPYVPPGTQRAHLEDAKRPLIITEGEKKALCLSQYLGTTHLIVGLAGVWNWRGRDASTGESRPIPDIDRAITWTDRQVYVMFDSDSVEKKPVQQAERALAEELTTRGAVVLCCRIPANGNAKIGIDDYLCDAGDQAQERLNALLSEARPPGELSERKQRETQTMRLLRVARAECCVLRDETGSTYLRRNGDAWRLRTTQTRAYLRRLHLRELGKPASAETVQVALEELDAEALTVDRTTEIHLRCAHTDGVLFYDLCNAHRELVRIDAEGWRIMSGNGSDVPVFIRHPHMRPQVRPSAPEDGNLSLILNAVNVQDEDSKILSQVYLAAAFIPTVARPIPLPYGAAGAGKTTLFKRFRQVIDPSVAEVLTMPVSEDELCLLLMQHYCAYFDNAQYLSASIMDALCRATTGAAFVKRALYTDAELVTWQIKRAVGCNGVSLVGSREDLLSRSILLRLDPIPESGRRQDDELDEEFKTALPKILSGIFTSLSGAFRIMPGMHLKRLPRMADFARYGAAIAESVGIGAEVFLSAYNNNIAGQAEEAIEGSPIAACVVKLMEHRTMWTGSPAELLYALTQTASDLSIETGNKWWPGTPSVLSRRLNESLNSLTSAGITVEIDRTERQRIITLTRLEAKNGRNDGIPDGNDGIEKNAVMRNLLCHNAPDGNDGNDGNFPTLDPKVKNESKEIGVNRGGKSSKNAVMPSLPSLTQAKALPDNALQNDGIHDGIVDEGKMPSCPPFKCGLCGGGDYWLGNFNTKRCLVCFPPPKSKRR
jgi:hypothetical protein